MDAVMLLHAALLGSAALWPLIDRMPERRVECTVYEAYAGGGKTPRGNFTVVLHEADKTGFHNGSTPLEGTWNGDPTLSVSIKAIDNGTGRFPLHVNVENHIATLDNAGNVGLRGTGHESTAEVRDDFVIELTKADNFGGHYEFSFHRKGLHWYRALLP